jgi:hypothetical protein
MRDEAHSDSPPGSQGTSGRPPPWRGRPLADLGDEPFVDDETRHLDQRRALAERTALEADIALGRYAAAVPELERLVDDDPLDESAVQMLMIALAGSGRVAAALRTFGAFRVRLANGFAARLSCILRHRSFIPWALTLAIAMTSVDARAIRGEEP